MSIEVYDITSMKSMAWKLKAEMSSHYFWAARAGRFVEDALIIVRIRRFSQQSASFAAMKRDNKLQRGNVRAERRFMNGQC